MAEENSIAIQAAIQAVRRKPTSGLGGSGQLGSTLRPVYGERRPMMYHLFESEMNQISSLNGIALAFFSMGSFCLSIDVAIGTSYAFASKPISDIGFALSVFGPLLSTGLALLFFGFGAYAVLTKLSSIELIKRETKTDIMI
jgi:hypothetical protein